MLGEIHSVFNDQLMCHFICWSAESPGVLRLDLPDYNSPSMVGVIKVGMAVDPRAKEIHVYQNWVLDLVYKRTAPRARTWECVYVR